MSSDGDVPLTVDFRIPEVTAAWVATAEDRPHRPAIRAAIAQLVRGKRHVLELGPGPGWLAETILTTCDVASYTLFDFAPPMLALCRERLARFGDVVQYVVGDFRTADWSRSLAPPFDAVVAMQAVHEIRHKRHVPGLYRAVRELLVPGGVLGVSDHAPKDDRPLCMTLAEQHAAFASAGFRDITTHPTPATDGRYLVSGSI